MLRFGEAGKYILSVFFVKGNKYFETKIPHSASKEGNVGFSMPWGWRKRRPDLPYFFWGSPSGKMILLTKKKTTMLTPPFRTVVPMLYSHPGTKCPATATQMQLMELTTQVTTQKASTYHMACQAIFPLLRNTQPR